jgi:hypothetical protein
MLGSDASPSVANACRTRTCSRCERELPLESFHRRRHYVSTSVRSACRDCTAKTVAAAREALGSRPSTELERLKERVRARTARAVARGEITRAPCEVCSDPNSEAHHPSYEGPDAHRDVHWLCRDHHMTTHIRRAWGRQLALPLP